MADGIRWSRHVRVLLAHISPHCFRSGSKFKVWAGPTIKKRQFLPSTPSAGLETC